MLNDSHNRYGVISKAIHWIMALLLGWQLLKLGDRIDDGEHWIGQTLVPWHVSIGSLLLLLITLRLLWSLKQRGQRPTQDPKTATLVRIGHGLLYLGMILMPLTGLAVMLGGGYGVKAFGFMLIPKSEGIELAKTIGSLHSPISWAFTILIIGHVGIALRHHFVKKDDTLRRML